MVFLFLLTEKELAIKILSGIEYHLNLVYISFYYYKKLLFFKFILLHIYILFIVIFWKSHESLFMKEKIHRIYFFIFLTREN